MEKIALKIILVFVMFMGFLLVVPFNSDLSNLNIATSTLSADCPPHLECDDDDGGGGTSCYQDPAGNSICYTHEAWCCCGDLMFRCDYGGGECQASWQAWCCDPTCLDYPCCYA